MALEIPSTMKITSVLAALSLAAPVFAQAAAEFKVCMMRVHSHSERSNQAEENVKAFFVEQFTTTKLEE